MNHREKLLEIYKASSSIEEFAELNEETILNIQTICKYFTSQKGVFTVLITLTVHKILYPEQDIRRHQEGMEGGFSGRTIDAKHITPTLKELGLPSMSESGWLTRSLEQPYPYTLDYNGKISNKVVKKAFLEILDFIEKNPDKAEIVLSFLLQNAIRASQKLVVAITPLDNPENITITNTINALKMHFDENFKTHGGSKLPVLAFYAIYEILMDELKRYNGCKLNELGSHTASDRTSKTAGDIEIFKGDALFEAIEIKLDKLIDPNIIRIAIEKINKFNPQRYYVLSHIGFEKESSEEIFELIDRVKREHGCQIIINGVLPTIRYYLRLIGNTEEFVSRYSDLVENDKELKLIHKTKWNEIIEAVFNK